MRNKTNRIIAVLMAVILAFNLAACARSGKLSEDPAEVMSKLQKAIQTSNEEDVLGLTMVEKGSSLYKEYKDAMDIDLYDDEMAGCYKAVAKNIKIIYSGSDVETGNGMAKVKVTFNMPDWEEAFGNKSISSAEDLIAAVEKAEPIGVNLTLRLIDTKEGLKIKNVEDLMDVFEFVGSDIVSATSWDEPTGTRPETTEPSEKKPAETKPDETKPDETEPDETEPSESKESKEPAKTPQPGSNDSLSAAYADYKKVLQSNADAIASFEKNVSKDSCGLSDVNGDGIPDLFFFTINPNEKYVNFYIYSYDPAMKATECCMSASLTEYDSAISEFAVIKCPNGDVVCYRGFIDDKNVISYYNLYQQFAGTNTYSYGGFIICGVVSGNTEKAVCSINGFKNYTSSTQIKYDEFKKIEKDMITKSDLLFGSKFTSSSKSTSGLFEGKKNSGRAYADVLKQLG